LPALASSIETFTAEPVPVVARTSRAVKMPEYASLPAQMLAIETPIFTGSSGCRSG
jgi:hypothetical protein